MAKDKFEEALQKLEVIVKKMESGEMSLDDSLKAFEEGIKLARFCASMLDEAQRKVEQLISDKDGSLKLAPFEDNAQ